MAAAALAGVSLRGGGAGKPPPVHHPTTRVHPAALSPSVWPLFRHGKRNAPNQESGAFAFFSHDIFEKYFLNIWALNRGSQGRLRLRRAATGCASFGLPAIPHIHWGNRATPRAQRSEQTICLLR